MVTLLDLMVTRTADQECEVCDCFVRILVDGYVG